MTARLSACKRLVKSVEKALPRGWEFDDGDRLVLAEIESAETRRAALIALFESETARPSPSAHKTVALAAEVSSYQRRSRDRVNALLSATEEPAPKSLHQKGRKFEMAARSWRTTGDTACADLRAVLLAEHIEIRDTVGYPLVRRGDQIVRSEHPGLAYPLWSAMVDQFASGGEFQLSTWELPDAHPARFEGSLQDRLILGADDVLREPD